MKKTVRKGYVTDGKGSYLVQLPNDSQWGFMLASDDQTWDGGFGSGFRSFYRVSASDVPAKERRRLGWLLKEK